MTELEPKTSYSDCGIALLDLDSACLEIHSMLGKAHYPHILLQSRQFTDGKRCHELYRELTENGTKLIVNIDSSTQSAYKKYFAQVPEEGSSTEIRFTNKKYSNIPLAGLYVGRNHVRMILVGETAFVSSFDFAESSFDRDELFIRVTQPELVQMLKIVAMWNFSNPKEKWQESAGGFDLIFDSGKSSKGYLSRYAEEQIEKRLRNNSVLWMVSSWCPDELEKLVNSASESGCQINLLINRQYEYESLRNIPFNITKMLSNLHYSEKTRNANCTIYHPTENQIHAKFLMVENGEQCWWLVGTSNHTRFGSAAMTTEIGIAGEDRDIGNELTKYISTINKVIVRKPSFSGSVFEPQFGR